MATARAAVPLGARRPRSSDPLPDIEAAFTRLTTATRTSDVRFVGYATNQEKVSLGLAADLPRVALYEADFDT